MKLDGERCRENEGDQTEKKIAETESMHGPKSASVSVQIVVAVFFIIIYLPLRAPDRVLHKRDKHTQRHLQTTNTEHNRVRKLELQCINNRSSCTTNCSI